MEKKSNVAELNYKELCNLLGKRVYDAVSREWITLVSIPNKEIESILVDDGTFIFNDPLVLKGRFYLDFQKLTDSQKEIQDILEQTEFYEKAASSTMDDYTLSRAEKYKKIREIREKIDELGKPLRSKEGKQIFINSIICIKTLLILLDEEYDS